MTTTVRPPRFERVRELVDARELLRNLTIRELKVRYRRSALGFLWTLLNPLLMMAVFTLVFGIAFKAPIDDFPLFFLAGYLPWAFFQASVTVSTGIVVGNAQLVTKVAFPRTVLPLSVVFSQLIHLGLALLVLFAVLGLAGYNFLPFLPILAMTIVILAVFTTGVSLIFAAGNTLFRDIQELNNVLFLLWFYLTPVVWSPDLVPASYRAVFQFNPLYNMIVLARTSLYDLEVPSLSIVASSSAWAIASLIGGWILYERLSARFAKEL